MFETSPFLRNAVAVPTASHHIDGRIDSSILESMVRQLYLAATQPDPGVSQEHAFFYSLKERDSRTHRIVIYQPESLLSQKSLVFVGFVSEKKANVPALVAVEVEQTDQKLVVALANVPGLLSYSSMHLRSGRWYNLVMLTDADVMQQLRGLHSHTHAAYTLSPDYYNWIRLHHGLLPRGIRSTEMRLVRTKYYTFVQQERPTVHEVVWSSELVS